MKRYLKQKFSPLILGWENLLGVPNRSHSSGTSWGFWEGTHRSWTYPPFRDRIWLSRPCVYFFSTTWRNWGPYPHRETRNPRGNRRSRLLCSDFIHPVTPAGSSYTWAAPWRDTDSYIWVFYYLFRVAYFIFGDHLGPLSFWGTSAYSRVPLYDLGNRKQWKHSDRYYT